MSHVHDDDGDAGAPYEGMSPSEYLKTRFSTLRPAMLDLPNPFKLLGLLSGMQWAFFAVAFMAWVSPPRISWPCHLWSDANTLSVDLGCL